MSPHDIADAVCGQVEQYGYSVVRVNNGFVFTFTADLLRKMVATADAKGTVVVLVEEPPESIPFALPETERN